VWQHPTGVGAGLGLRYVGNYKECQSNNCNGGAPSRDIGSWYKADLFGSYVVKSAAGTTTVTVGVNNVLDRAPATIYGGIYGDSDASTYDFMGRFFYGRMTQTF
jgi:outer membrane receptor protein involved in Fe transport